MKTNSLEDLNSWTRSREMDGGAKTETQAKKAKINVQNRAGLANLFKN